MTARKQSLAALIARRRAFEREWLGLMPLWWRALRIIGIVGTFAALLAVLFLASSCGGITGQHPAWQCASSYAGPLGAGIATLITGSPVGILTATSIAVSGCQAEASLVGGPPATTTTTTTTSVGTTTGPAPSATPTATPTPAARKTP